MRLGHYHGQNPRPLQEKLILPGALVQIILRLGEDLEAAGAVAAHRPVEGGGDRLQSTVCSGWRRSSAGAAGQVAGTARVAAGLN